MNVIENQRLVFLLKYYIDLQNLIPVLLSKRSFSVEDFFQTVGEKKDRGLVLMIGAIVVIKPIVKFIQPVIHSFNFVLKIGAIVILPTFIHLKNMSDT